MGKGRNRRHSKRRKEQSRKNKRENKKQKKAKEKKWKNQPNPPPKYRKRKRNKGKNMFNYRNVQCIHLGMSGRFLIEPKYAEYLVQFKEWYNEGVITDISFLVFGEWNTKTKKRLCGLLADNGNEWAINHLLFRNSDEYDASFMLKRARCLDITHYIDMDKDNISTFVMSNLYGRLKLFWWDEDHAKGWEEFRDWLKRHNPTHYNLWEQGEQAAEIIQTGIYAEKETVETFTSEGYEDDGVVWDPDVLEAT